MHFRTIACWLDSWHQCAPPHEDNVITVLKGVEVTCNEWTKYFQLLGFTLMGVDIVCVIVHALK